MMIRSSALLLIFSVVTSLTLTDAQNSSCSPPDGSVNMDQYHQIARSAIFRYLNGDDEQEFKRETSRKVVTEENLAFIKSFMQILDPQQVKESAYTNILDKGEIPDGPTAKLGVNWAIESKVTQYIRSLRGPAKVTLNFLRDHPELKYNTDELKKRLSAELMLYKDTNEPDHLTNRLTLDEDPLLYCRADLDYLYDPLLQTLGCIIREAINGIILDLLGGCRICILFTCYNLCLDVTAPSRSIPPMTGTFIDAQFKIPPGLTQGNLHWAGSYDQCNRIDEVTYNSSLVGLPDEMRSFKPRYCRVKAWPAGAFVNGSTPGLSLSLGVCLPNSCATPGVIRNITADFEVIGLRVFEMFCGFDDLKLQDDPSSVACVAIIIILAILVIIATLYDMLVRKQLMVQKIRKVAPYLGSTPSPKEDKPMPGTGPPSPVTFTLGGEDKNIHGVKSNGVHSNGVNSNGLPIQNPISRQTSYTEMDEDDYRRFSLTSNQDLILSRPPSYISQVSAMSTSDLLNNELGAIKTQKSTNALDGPPSWLERIEGAFVAFSSYSNTLRIFDMNATPDRLISCDGVKFMSLVWSTYGFTWLLGTLYSEAWTTTNLLPTLMNVREFLFQIVINFPFSSDSTFVVAGCLLTYNWMRNFDKEKKITWKTMVHYYLHRYFRLMIPLMLVLMFYTCLYKLLVAGPLIPPQISDADRCREQWYINLFLLHNLINGNGMCLTWTTNVAILFQFHLIGPLILIPLALLPVLGYVMFGLTYLAHLITLGIFSAKLADQEGLDGFGVWLNDILLTPWCRAGPILIGMAVGYALYLHKKKPFNVHWLARVIAWICTIGLLMAPIFSTYDALREGGNSWNRAAAINYQLWSRNAFGLGVGWLIFSAETGIGGFPGRFLRYKQWIPLSRLSYVTLLLSAIFIFRNVYSQMEPITITGHVILYFFFGNMTFSLIVAFVLSLLMQFPFCEVENAFLHKTKRDLIKMGRNPLNEMMKSQPSSPKISVTPPYLHSVSSNPEISTTTPSGLTVSGRPAMDLHRSISHTSQL